MCVFFCINVYNKYNLKKKIFLLQKKIVRIMTFAPYLAHTEPFNSLELLPV